MNLAASPGVDFKSPALYSAVVHHSRLAELLSAYVLSVPSTPLDPILMKWGDFQPQSTLLEDGRLRRIILCDRWTPEREQMERFSWRTAADCAITNRPMVITALIIGSLRDGFRPSPWTQGFLHPANGGLRIQKRDGNFNDSWKKTYREQSGVNTMDWLKIMQQDEAFDGLVHTVVEPVWDRAETLAHMEKMAFEMASSHSRQTRSACYRFTPCPFLSACSTSRSPAELGWVERPLITVDELTVVR